MNHQDERHNGDIDEQLGEVFSTLYTETATDPETQVTRITMTGTLSVDVTPVVTERGHTVYVIGGTMMQYAKRKSAIEAALRHHVTQAFDQMWERENPKPLPGEKPATSNKPRSSKSAEMEQLRQNISETSKAVDAMTVTMRAMMEALMTKESPAGHQNGNHDTDLKNTKTRLSVKN